MFVRYFQPIKGEELTSVNYLMVFEGAVNVDTESGIPFAVHSSENFLGNNRFKGDVFTVCKQLPKSNLSVDEFYIVVGDENMNLYVESTTKNRLDIKNHTAVNYCDPAFIHIDLYAEKAYDVLVKEIIEKLNSEFEGYIKELTQKTAQEIIDERYKLFYFKELKELIVDFLEERYPSEKSLKLISSYKFPLTYFYDCWQKWDGVGNIMDFLMEFE